MAMSNSELEQLAYKYMQKLQISREEAYQLIADDNSDELTPEQKALTEKAKSMGRHYETSDKERKKSTRQRKVNETKGYLLDEIEICLQDLKIEITGRQTETEIHFNFEGKAFTLKLTEHRNKKNKA